MKALPFRKMHGLGNDFVVIDGRGRPLSLSAAAVRAIADRRTGVGCDQLIVLEAARDASADAVMVIRNADGGEVGACGNAARCVGSLLMAETGRDAALIETRAGLVAAAAEDGAIAVDLGLAASDWAAIPLSVAVDTLHLPVAVGTLADPVAVGVGNPHAVFFVADADAGPLDQLGPAIEHHPLFPERTNVEVVEVLARDRLRLRVWERGVGVTRACGTGAAAAVVAASRRGLIDRAAAVRLDGGTLAVRWRDDGHAVITGPVATAFHGVLDPAFLGAILGAVGGQDGDDDAP